MPYFSFDLVIGEVFKNQGVMILEDTEIAIDKADSLAEEICVACVLRDMLCALLTEMVVSFTVLRLTKFRRG